MDPNLTTGLAQVFDLETSTTALYSSVAPTPAYQYVIPISAIAFLSVFSALIIVCNVLVLLVYTFTNTLRIPVSAYMKSLAVADLWVGVNCAINIAFTLNNGQWPFGLPLCKLTAYLLVVSVGVSVTSLTAISIDRYVAICHPMRYRNLISKQRARFFAILVWILSALLYLPSNFDWFRSNPALQANDCTLHFRYNISFSFFLLALTIIPNFIISFVSYSFILATLMKRKVWLRKTTECGMNPQGDCVKARRKEQDKLMAKIGMAILSAFYITWLPYLVFGTLRQLKISNPSQTVINLSLYLGISNSFLNCFIYSIANKAFRTGVKDLFKKLCCTCCPWKNSLVQSSTESSNFVHLNNSSEKNGEPVQGIANAMHELS